MRIIYIIKKIASALILLTLLYVIVSILLIFSTPRYKPKQMQTPKTFYLYHNLAHTEIILKGSDLSAKLTKLLTPAVDSPKQGFIAFSYGDARFMAYTPTWSDINFMLALRALFINTQGAIRVGHYRALRHDRSVIPVTIDAITLAKLQETLCKSFRYEKSSLVLLDLPHPPYIRYFEATHPYNLFYTCNQWTAQILRSADLPAPRWAPFAFEVAYPFTNPPR